jgi:exodeoxyribonuclease V alpha subunit
MSAANVKPDKVDLADIDRHFASFIRRFGGGDPISDGVASLLSRAVRQGNICLDVRKIDSTELSLSSSWKDRLAASPAFGPPEAPAAPIVVIGHRIYLRRYWEYEQALAESVLERVSRNGGVPNRTGTQDEVIEAALKNHFTIISGGPGTGKTTTVLKILLRFVKQLRTTKPRIALATPTGKAAARIQEVLRTIIEQDNNETDPDDRSYLPRNASTIHRLLGYIPDSVFFRHDRRNPLPVDILVVDEASMVDLPLMAKLFDALPDNARVILVGDRDQLASVAPGAVLADIADSATIKDSPLRNALFVLTHNHRFEKAPAIYQLSNAVRLGDSTGALNILQTQSSELSGKPVPAAAQIPIHLEHFLSERYKSYLKEKDPLKALEEFGRSKVLCALREGPVGVTQINAAIETLLHQRRLISDPMMLYAGMPILITKNDYQTQLFNGDIGIILPDPTEPDNDQLWAWFIGADGALRRFSIGRLPEYELAYAMTVHKAQGSQFEHVLFILPERDSPVLTRELIYTGVTRASTRVEVWFSEPTLRLAVERKAVRYSGLTDALLRPQSA